MPNCPNCKAEIPDDFGLITCASCGSSLMIGMDGSAELADGGSSDEDLFAAKDQFTNAIANEVLEQSISGAEPLEFSDSDEDLFTDDQEPLMPQEEEQPLGEMLSSQIDEEEGLPEESNLEVEEDSTPQEEAPQEGLTNYAYEGLDDEGNDVF